MLALGGFRHDHLEAQRHLKRVVLGFSLLQTRALSLFVNENCCVT